MDADRSGKEKIPPLRGGMRKSDRSKKKIPPLCGQMKTALPKRQDR